MTRDDVWKPGNDWRPLSSNESQLLAILTSMDFQGSVQLASQIEFAQAQQGCGCGCGTINLKANRSDVPPARLLKQPVPGKADVLDDDGTVVGGLILFAREGYLSRLEIFNWGDVAFLPLPDASRIKPNLKK